MLYVAELFGGDYLILPGDSVMLSVVTSTRIRLDLKLTV